MACRLVGAKPLSENLHKGKNGPFDPASFLCILSSIQCNSVGMVGKECPFLPIEGCGPNTAASVFKALANEGVMSLELCVRMAPGLQGPFRCFV